MKIIYCIFPTIGRVIFKCIWLLKASSNPALNTFRDVASAATLCNLFQGFITFISINFFIISKTISQAVGSSCSLGQQHLHPAAGCMKWKPRAGGSLQTQVSGKRSHKYRRGQFFKQFQALLEPFLRCMRPSGLSCGL